MFRAVATDTVMKLAGWPGATNVIQPSEDAPDTETPGRSDTTNWISSSYPSPPGSALSAKTTPTYGFQMACTLRIRSATRTRFSAARYRLERARGAPRVGRRQTGPDTVRTVSRSTPIGEGHERGQRSSAGSHESMWTRATAEGRRWRP